MDKASEAALEQTDDDWLENVELPDSLLNVEPETLEPDLSANDGLQGDWPLIPSGTPVTSHQVDGEKLANWVYPINFSVRSYQFNMVRSALLKNSLISLPTGLGKTFIAAVVMCNYYRWFPDGKVIFLAPTRPLVAQQIEACYQITGFNAEDLCELTGQLKADQRRKYWAQKRIFFITPQVMTNDLKSGILPGRQVVLLVLDEAHRAQGNYAYCECIRILDGEVGQSNYRVLALSATPGTVLTQVQSVVDSLKIVDVELRTEASLDVQQYMHGRRKDIRVLELSPFIIEVKQVFASVLVPFLNQLKGQHAFYSSDPEQVSRYSLIMSREKFRKSSIRGPRAANPSQLGMVEGLFGILISLFGMYQLLQSHGIQCFYSSFEQLTQEVTSGSKKVSRVKRDLVRNPQSQSLLQKLRSWLAPETAPAGFESHPKLGELVRVILDHFHGRTPDEVSNSRVMVFSQFRESVDEIAGLLNKHSPLIRATAFIGQSSGKLKKRGMVQRQQLETIQLFKEGTYNVLIATSIGEEGLDIGEIDLIVCFDSQSSPIRMLQRMGRTGRKRQGRIVVLVTAGKEEAAYKKSLSSYKSVQEAMADKSKIKFFTANPAMLPLDARPTLLKTVIDTPDMPLLDKGNGGCKKRAVGVKYASVVTNVSRSFLTAKEYSDYLLRYAISEPVMISVSGLLQGQSKMQRGRYIGAAARRVAYVNLTRKFIHLKLEDADDLLTLQDSFDPRDVEQSCAGAPERATLMEPLCDSLSLDDANLLSTFGGAKRTNDAPKSIAKACGLSVNPSDVVNLAESDVASLRSLSSDSSTPTAILDDAIAFDLESCSLECRDLLTTESRALGKPANDHITVFAPSLDYGDNASEIVACATNKRQTFAEILQATLASSVRLLQRGAPRDCAKDPSRVEERTSLGPEFEDDAENVDCNMDWDAVEEEIKMVEGQCDQEVQDANANSHVAMGKTQDSSEKVDSRGSDSNICIEKAAAAAVILILKSQADSASSALAPGSSAETANHSSFCNDEELDDYNWEEAISKVAKLEDSLSQESEVSSPRPTTASVQSDEYRVPVDERLKRLYDARKAGVKRAPPRERGKVTPNVPKRVSSKSSNAKVKRKVGTNSLQGRRNPFLDLEAHRDGSLSESETQDSQDSMLDAIEDVGSLASFVVGDDQVSYASNAGVSTPEPPKFVFNSSQEMPYGNVGRYKLQYNPANATPYSSLPQDREPMLSESDLSNFVVSDGVVEHATDETDDWVLDA